VLAGGGEMGALMRRTDWSSTPLGAVETWPQSLRTAVSILLDSRFGMYIAWGPRYVQLYNDGYRPILGSTKHPQALGNFAASTFAESWDIIGPMFDEVRRGNATGSDDWMLPLDRHGYLEECFFTFSYSPIRDESGGVGGVHVTVTETTARVLAARRLRALQALADGSRGRRTAEEACAACAVSLGAAQADLPFVLLYLLSDDGREARLAGATGVEPGSSAAPLRLSLGGASAPPSWPLSAALGPARVAVVGDLAATFGDIVSSVWPEPVHTAAMVSLRRGAVDAPYGVLVAGVSPRRALDVEYTDFLTLIATRAATAVADARAGEEERRLVESERARLYAHFVQAPFPVAVLRGPEFFVELANPAALAVWGKTPALVGQNLLQGFPELQGQPFVGYLEGVLRTGVAYEGRGVLGRMPRGPDGEFRDVYFNFVYSPLHDRAGAVEGVLVAGFEVTAEVLARREVEEAQRLFKLVIDNVPELAWTARPDGFIDFYNQRWYEYTGTTPKQMEGWGWRSAHDPAHLDEVLAKWGRAIATGLPFEMEFPLRGGDGVFRWFLTRVRPLHDAEGKLVRWFGTNTNIDERVRLLASEKEAREEAERSSRAKDEFLAMVSHELRNPLNAMLGWTRMLRAGALPEERRARALEIVERNAINQAQLIDDLLDVSRIISGQLRLDVQSLSLARIVEAALESARPAIEAKGLQLSVELDRGAGELAGDPTRLQQVVWNLLTNATKFTPHGGSLGIALNRDGPFFELTVADSGQGISAEFLPFVFDRFRQADPSTTKAQGGLGLGLAITKNLVEMHGGSIAVESRGLGTGTRFIVRLPTSSDARESGPGVPRPAREAPSMAFEPPPEIRGLHVLVVDDEPDGRDMVAATLASCGATVVTAASVADAMEEFERARPDVVLSDIGMPGEDGYSFIARLRALPRSLGGATPAACLTGYASVQDRRRALLAGFTMHVPKPLDPAELVAVVASLARMARTLGGTPVAERPLE
jgi:PAS domain S-box-containing protein